MVRRKTIEEWHAEQLLRQPGFQRNAEDFMAHSGRPRKIPVLCDENLEQEFISELRADRKFRVTTAPKGTSDRLIWQRACKGHLVIVTGDEDFWDDHRFPLRQSYGVIILKGPRADDRLEAMMRVRVGLDLPGNYARIPDMLGWSKTRASAETVQHKFLDDSDGSIVYVPL